MKRLTSSQRLEHPDRRAATVVSWLKCPYCSKVGKQEVHESSRLHVIVKCDACGYEYQISWYWLSVFARDIAGFEQSKDQNVSP